MAQASRFLPDLEAEYEVLKGSAYQDHESENCDACALSLVHASSLQHPISAPLAIHAPSLKIVLLKPVSFSQSQVATQKLSSLSGLGNMGFFLTDWIGDVAGFIADVVTTIIGAIADVVKAIVNAMLHPLDTLKAAIRTNLDLITGQVFLHALDVFPLTHWLYQGVDELTGGFISNLNILTQLPGRFYAGETITRADLIRGLSALKVVLIAAASYITGGAAIAIVGTSVGLLKAGPIGKTVVGRTLLDIVGIGAAALAGGTDLVEAFAMAGAKKIEEAGLGKLAADLGIKAVLVKLISHGVQTAVATGSDATEESDGEEIDAGEEIVSSDETDPETDDFIPDPDEAHAIDTSLSDEEIEAEFDEEFEFESELDAEEEDLTDQESEELEKEEGENEEDISAEEAESGLTDPQVLELLKVGISITDLSLKLLKRGYAPKAVKAAAKQGRRLKRTVLPHLTNVKPLVVKKPKVLDSKTASHLAINAKNKKKLLELSAKANASQSSSKYLFIGASVLAGVWYLTRKK